MRFHSWRWESHHEFLLLQISSVEERIPTVAAGDTDGLDASRLGDPDRPHQDNLKSSLAGEAHAR